MRVLSAHTTGPARPVLSIARLFHVIGLLALLPVRAFEARRQLSALGALNDHELADIGIGRHDLRNAASLSRGEDPTAYLASVAADLARARRAEARTVARIGRRNA